jgi:hypothetical protein
MSRVSIATIGVHLFLDLQSIGFSTESRHLSYICARISNLTHHLADIEAEMDPSHSAGQMAHVIAQVVSTWISDQPARASSRSRLGDTYDQACELRAWLNVLREELGRRAARADRLALSSHDRGAYSTIRELVLAYKASCPTTERNLRTEEDWLSTAMARAEEFLKARGES